MWSKRPIFCLCLLTSAALAPALPGQSSGRSYNTVTEASSVHDHQTQSSNAWPLYNKLSVGQVQANPNTYNVQDDPFRRSLCAL
jgi:hypothetical protein